MSVREGMRSHAPPFDLLENPTSVKRNAGVDQHAVHQVDIHGVGRKAAELEDVVGKWFDDSLRLR